MGCVRRRLLQRLADHLGHIVVLDAPWTTAAGFVVKAVEILRRKPVAPLPGGLVGDTHRGPDLHVGEPFGRQKNDPGAVRQRTPNLASPHQPFQFAALVLGQIDHHRRSHHRVPPIAIAFLTKLTLRTEQLPSLHAFRRSSSNVRNNPGGKQHNFQAASYSRAIRRGSTPRIESYEVLISRKNIFDAACGGLKVRASSENSEIVESSTDLTTQEAIVIPYFKVRLNW